MTEDGTNSERCEHPTCNESLENGSRRRAGTDKRFCSSECLLDYWNNHAGNT